MRRGDTEAEPRSDVLAGERSVRARVPPHELLEQTRGQGLTIETSRAAHTAEFELEEPVDPVDPPEPEAGVEDAAGVEDEAAGVDPPLLDSDPLELALSDFEAPELAVLESDFESPGLALA